MREQRETYRNLRKFCRRKTPLWMVRMLFCSKCLKQRTRVSIKTRLLNKSTLAWFRGQCNEWTPNVECSWCYCSPRSYNERVWMTEARKRELAKFLHHACESATFSTAVAVGVRVLTIAWASRSARCAPGFAWGPCPGCRDAKKTTERWLTGSEHALALPYLAEDLGVLAHALFGEVLHDCA